MAIMRLADVTLAFPSIILAMAITMALGPSLRSAIIYLTIAILGGVVSLAGHIYLYARPSERSAWLMFKLSSLYLALIFAGMIIAGAVGRFINPRVIEYREAIMIAVIGLGVNILSAFLLHHDHEESDHNIRAAYLHVIADAFTSLAAIIGLVTAMIWGVAYIDAIAALISSFVIIKWSLGLLKVSGSDLIK